MTVDVSCLLFQDEKVEEDGGDERADAVLADQRLLRGLRKAAGRAQGGPGGGHV